MKYNELFWDVLLAKAVDLTRYCLKWEALASVGIDIRKTVQLLSSPESVSSWQEHPSILFYLNCRTFLCASYSRFRWMSSSDKLRQEKSRCLWKNTWGTTCGGSWWAQRSCFGLCNPSWEHQHGKKLFLLIGMITGMRWWNCGIGYWLIGYEGKRNNCFSKIQLVGPKILRLNIFRELKLEINPF